ncbi:hypothetical protein GCM10022243_01290 [Saccharothrix violaceirubra]|uniref:Uncharacterized protein n=1 Tax=Saccharothrix violaceirubra TaxID=413306 RepID=A0A7W7WVX5_9PSEU|nr:hypothetical protein [Saccharothrix violaceirubra]MBB4965372.1 hypothetical protein [Saccharothrix violaceirubra]
MPGVSSVRREFKMKPVVFAFCAVAVASAGCSSGEVGPDCRTVSDPAVGERIGTAVRDVVEHRARAIVNTAEGSAPLVLSDKSVQVSPEAEEFAQRAYSVLSWFYANRGYVRYEINDVKVDPVSACGSTVVAEVNGSTNLYRRAGDYTGSAFGPMEFEFDTTGGRWTLNGHRLVGVVKQRPLIEPEDSMYAEFDRR